MMNKLPMLLAAAACSTLPLATIRAQEPSPAPTVAPAASATPAVSPSPAATPDDGTSKQAKNRTRAKEALRSLPREDRQKLRKAREAAQADPAVQAAKASGDKRAAAKATREAMVRNDPSVAPILDKARTEMRESRQTSSPGMDGKVKRGGMMERQLAGLSPEERTKVVGAMQTAQSDPKVAALEKERKAATTPEAKAKAGKAHREALREAMLRNDPSLAPILQKMQAQRKAKAENDDL